MVDSSWTYEIKHYDKSNSWASADITVDSFPRAFSDVVDTEISTGVIRIRCEDGQYIQSGVNGKTQIVVNDRIQIHVTDDESGDVKFHMYEVIKKKPIKTKREGVMLELELMGIEMWTQRVNYVKRNFGTNAGDAATDLIAFYNEEAAIATHLPTMVVSRNNLPTTLALTLDWGVNEETVFNRLIELSDLQSSSGSAGGVLDFFDVRFSSYLNNPLAFKIEIFSSGDDPTTSGTLDGPSTPIVTVSTDSVNGGTEDTDAGFEEPEGTNIHIWGANGAGTKPTNFSRFQSRQIIMPDDKGSHSLFPEWDVNFGYKTGSLIKYTVGVDKVYERTGGDITPPAATTPIIDPGWTELTENDYSGSIQYSPWTDEQQIKWKVSGGDPTSAKSPYTSACGFDINVVVRDDTSFQTWVDLKSTSDTLDGVWLYGGTTPYDGLRVLVAGGAGADAFNGFTDSIMEYRDGAWIERYAARENMMCAVFDEATVYKYTSGTWTSLATDSNGLHCFHPMDNGTTDNDDSAFKLNDGADTESTANIDSAVHVSYSWTPLAAWTNEWSTVIQSIANVKWPSTSARDLVDWYKAGAWLGIRFPIPKNSNGGAGAVGELHGGSTSTNIVPFLDAQNMDYLSDGTRGFNQGDLSEEYGAISSIDFATKLRFSRFSISNGREDLHKGNFKMRAFIIDRNDNVASQDFVIAFNNEWQPVSLPIDSFQIYRGRRPRFEDGFTINDMIPPIGRPNINQFEWRHITMIGIQTQESYDDDGKYRGASDNDLGTGTQFWEELGLTVASLRMDLWIDAFRFGKPLLANSGQETDILNQPDFLNKPDIGTYDQLKNDAKAELEKTKFQKKVYQLRTPVAFDIAAGDYFYFNDSQIVDEADTGANTIKLVARHVDYTLSKAGGYERIITANKRFT